MSRNDSWSPLGVAAARAAYDHGDGWLASLVERLDQQRTLLSELLAAHLPDVRMRPLEATYFAWLDVSAYGHDDEAAVALERGRVRVSPGHSYARAPPATSGSTSPLRPTGSPRSWSVWQRPGSSSLAPPLVEEAKSRLETPQPAPPDLDRSSTPSRSTTVAPTTYNQTHDRDTRSRKSGG